MIFRIGCAKITSVATSILGVKIIRLLQSGKTIRETRKTICRQLGVVERQLNLSAVVQAIMAARMIRRIDNRVLESLSPSVYQMILHRLQFAFQRSRNWARDAVIKYLPVNAAHQVLCFAQRRRHKSRFHPSIDHAHENLRRALLNRLIDNDIEAITAEYHSERVRRTADTQLLRNLEPPKMVRWLQEAAEFTGLEHLATAQAAGCGVILCGFHFGAPQLLVPFLWRRGISFVFAAAIPPIRGRNPAAKILLDKSYTEKYVEGCGTVTWYTKFSLRGVLEMMKAIEKGETVLVFPDGYFNRPNREIARYFGHLAAEYRPAQVSVPFLGGTILANLMVPWLFLETRAPVLPIKLLRKRGATFEITIEPVLDLADVGSLNAAAERLYGALERDIYKHPAPWNYWDRLHEFTAQSPTLADKPSAKASGVHQVGVYPGPL